MSKKNQPTFKIITPQYGMIPVYEYDISNNNTFRLEAYPILPKCISSYNGPGIYDSSPADPSSRGSFQMDFEIGEVDPGDCQFVAGLFDTITAPINVPYIGVHVDITGDLVIVVTDEFGGLVNIAYNDGCPKRSTVRLYWDAKNPLPNGKNLRAYLNNYEMDWVWDPAQEWTPFKTDKVMIGSTESTTYYTALPFQGKIYQVQTGYL